MTELEGTLIYKYVVLFSPLFSQDIWCTHSEEIDLPVHEKRNYSFFYAFELMIYFLAEEGFLNMHSDILSNLTPGVLIV